MKEQQNEDSEIVELKTVLKHCDPGSKLLKRILYYISDPDDDPFLRIYSKSLKSANSHKIS